MTDLPTLYLWALAAVCICIGAVFIAMVFAGGKRKTKPVTTLTGFYGFKLHLDTAPDPKIDRVNREDARTP